MRGEKNHTARRNIAFWGVLATLIVVSFLIIKNYITTILTALVLAYLIKPVYNKLEKKTGKIISAIISTILIILIVSLLIIIPLGLILGEVGGSEAFGKFRFKSIFSKIRNVDFFVNP